ncbi:flagellar motor protein MotB [Arenibacterium sp. CAU 1754]
MSAQTNVAPVIIKRKKVSGGDGHHGGAWKVAYADFVTAMMAFFMLMWLLNATTEKQRKGLADYFSPSIPIHRVSSGSDNPFGGSSVFSEDTLLKDGIGATAAKSAGDQHARGHTGVDLARRQSAENDQFKAIDEALNGRGGESLVTDEALKHVVTRVTDEGLIIEIFAQDDAPLFERNGDAPTRLMRELTAMISRVTARVENGIAVSGHVMANPVVQADNPVWELSVGRAGHTRVLLEVAGTDPDRIKRVTGQADRQPAVDNRMSVRNNRIEITLLRSDRSK